MLHVRRRPPKASGSSGGRKGFAVSLHSRLTGFFASPPTGFPNQLQFTSVLRRNGTPGRTGGHKGCVRLTAACRPTGGLFSATIHVGARRHAPDARCTGTVGLASQTAQAHRDSFGRSFGRSVSYRRLVRCHILDTTINRWLPDTKPPRWDC